MCGWDEKGCEAKRRVEAEKGWEAKKGARSGPVGGRSRV